MSKHPAQPSAPTKAPAVDQAYPRRIAVIGAGMAGLVAAYELSKDPTVQLILFEATDRLGGTVETVHHQGFTIECGPDSWVSDKSAAYDLAVELGLGPEIIPSNDSVRRNYLVQGRTLQPMPDGMRMMVPTRWLPILESPLFSWQARLAYLREPKRAEELKREAQSRPDDFDESVRSFVHRHFGDEATEKVAGPLLAGVFGGDIDTLSAGAVLAPFVRLEREHGSLIAPTMAAIEKQKAEGKPPPPVFTTLRSGLSTLIDRLAAALPPESIRRNTPVIALAQVGDPARWIVTTSSTTANDSVSHFASSAAPDQPAPASDFFDAVILATPAHVSRALLAPLDTEAATLLHMEATSAIVVAFCFSPESSAKLRIPRGFGFLVPPARTLHDDPELLAGTFMHQKFHHRAPSGAVFLRGFFGGHAAPRMLHWDDQRIAAAAHRQFSLLLGPLPPPLHTVVRRWPLSLPQYRVGHPGRMRKLQAHIARLPGLVLTGNAYQGVGLPALVHHGQQAARAAVQAASARS
ncbi:protoporphyrinogen oxidase [Acidipila sp. EB88]|uniref:protoporphyrinogen oxidase n=1 Tax=Acidipila sp. EB88 TaxID=2305226 RepID=UPI000F602AC0|nr:protoporphyrinogen oxidase [Acidipila sp. EB88]RRA47915.1 protoporphyrinogen oxidase [Acidipila sp. EB88]